MSAPVLMYRTENCPSCHRAEALLKARGVSEIEIIRVDLDPARRDEMIARTGRRTVPQIFIGATHVGGFAGAQLARALLDFARAHLSHVKVPRLIEFTPELPRHPNGKLYKRLLRDAYATKTQGT